MVPPEKQKSQKETVLLLIFNIQYFILSNLSVVKCDCDDYYDFKKHVAL